MNALIAIGVLVVVVLVASAKASAASKIPSDGLSEIERALVVKKLDVRQILGRGNERVTVEAERLLRATAPLYAYQPVPGGLLVVTRNRAQAEAAWKMELETRFPPGTRRAGDKFVYKATYPYDPDEATRLAPIVAEDLSNHLGFYTPERVAEFQQAAGIRNENGVSDGRYGGVTRAALIYYQIPEEKAPAPIYAPHESIIYETP